METIQLPEHALVARNPSQRWLILWPGLGGTAEQFLQILNEAPHLEANVLALDPPGHGRTPAVPRLSWDDVWQIWQRALNWVDGEGARTVMVGGHSYGAYAALGSAAKDPRVQGYVLLDGGYLEPFPSYDREVVEEANARYLSSRRFPSWSAFLNTERAESRHWDANAESALKSAMIAIDGVIRPIVRASTANQVSALLSTYHVDALPHDSRPILLLVAGEPFDARQSREAAVTRFRTRHPHTEAAFIPKSGHDVVLDNPKAVLEYLRQFFQER